MHWLFRSGFLAAPSDPLTDKPFSPSRECLVCYPRIESNEASGSGRQVFLKDLPLAVTNLQVVEALQAEA
jgi:hypothetical protein